MSGIGGIGLAWLDERQMVHRRQERVLCEGCATPLNGYNPGPFCHACDAKEATKRYLAGLEKEAEEEHWRIVEANIERMRERDRQRRKRAKQLKISGRRPENVPLLPPSAPPGPGEPHVQRQRYWTKPREGRTEQTTRVRVHLWVVCSDCEEGRWAVSDRKPHTPEGYMARTPRCHSCQARVNARALNASKGAT